MYNKGQQGLLTLKTPEKRKKSKYQHFCLRNDKSIYRGLYTRSCLEYQLKVTEEVLEFIQMYVFHPPTEGK